MTATATEQLPEAAPETEFIGEARPPKRFPDILPETTDPMPDLLQLRVSELLELTNTLELMNSARARGKQDTPVFTAQEESVRELVQRGTIRGKGKKVPSIVSQRLQKELNDRGVYLKYNHKIQHYAPVTQRLAHLIDRQLSARGIERIKMDNELITMTPDELQTTMNLLLRNYIADKNPEPPIDPAHTDHVNEIRLVSRGIQRSKKEPLSPIEGPLGLQFPDTTITADTARAHLAGAAEPTTTPGVDVNAENKVIEGDPVDTVVSAPEHPENPVDWVHTLQELHKICQRQAPEAQAQTITNLLDAFHSSIAAISQDVNSMSTDDRMLLHREIAALYREFFTMTAPDAPIPLYPSGTPEPAPLQPYSLSLTMTDIPAFLTRMGLDPSPENIARMEAYIQNVNGPQESRHHLHTTPDMGLYATQLLGSLVYPKEATAAPAPDIAPPPTTKPSIPPPEAKNPTPNKESPRREKILSERDKQKEINAIFTEVADTLLFHGDINGYMGVVMAKHADVNSEAGRMWRRQMLKYIQTYDVDAPRKPYVKEYLQRAQARITEQILPATANPSGEVADFLQKRYKLKIDDNELEGFRRGDKPSALVLLDTRLRPHMESLWYHIMGPQNMENFFTPNSLLLKAGPHRSEDWAPWSPRRKRLHRLMQVQRGSVPGVSDGRIFAGSSFLTLLAHEQLPPQVTVVPEPTITEPPVTPPPTAERPPTEPLKPQTAERKTRNETRERNERRRWLTNFSREALTLGDARLHFATRIALGADPEKPLGRQLQREVLALVKQYNLGRVTNTAERTRLQKMQQQIPDLAAQPDPEAPLVTAEIRNRQNSVFRESELRGIDTQSDNYFSLITDQANHELQVPLSRIWAAVMPDGLSQEQFFTVNAMAGPGVYAREHNGKRTNWVKKEKTLQKAYRRAIKATTNNTTPLEQTAFAETIVSIFAFESRPQPVVVPDISTPPADEPSPIDEPLPIDTPPTDENPPDTDLPAEPVTETGADTAATDGETLAAARPIPEAIDMSTPELQQKERLRILAQVARAALDAEDARLFYAVRMASRANLAHPQGRQFQREILAMLHDYPLEHITDDTQRSILEEILRSVPPELAQLEKRKTTGELLHDTGIVADDKIRSIAEHTGTYRNVLSIQVNRGLLGVVLAQKWRDIMGTDDRDAFFTPENLGNGLPDDAIKQIAQLNNTYIASIPRDYPIPSDKYRVAFAEVLAFLMIHDVDRMAAKASQPAA